MKRHSTEKKAGLSREISDIHFHLYLTSIFSLQIKMEKIAGKWS